MMPLETPFHWKFSLICPCPRPLRRNPHPLPQSRLNAIARTAKATGRLGKTICLDVNAASLPRSARCR